MMVKIEVMQIKERCFTETFHLRKDKGDLKCFQQNLTLTSICYNLTPVSWRARKKKKKRKYTFEKRTALVW